MTWDESEIHSDDKWDNNDDYDDDDVDTVDNKEHSLDNVSDGNVQHTVVERMDLDSAADKSMTQWDRRRVNQIDTFATEPRVWLVFHNEHYVRWNQQ